MIVDKSVTDLGPLLSTGTSVMLSGKLTRTPEGTKQKVELRAQKILHIGPCDARDYPVAKTKLTLEYLRNHMHLRSRTNTVRKPSTWSCPGCDGIRILLAGSGMSVHSMNALSTLIARLICSSPSCFFQLRGSQTGTVLQLFRDGRPSVF